MYQTNLLIKLQPRPQSYKVIVDSEGEPPPPTIFDKYYFISNIHPIEREINGIIIDYLKDTTKVVHGAKAMNIQIPMQFQRRTDDWDVYSRTPFKDADKVEDLLDNIFHKDVFYTISVPLSADRGKVYRVINRFTGRSVADFTYKRNMPPHIIVDSIRYASLLYLRKKLESILKNKNAQYRWAKARADLMRIDRAIEYMRQRLGR